MSGALQISAIGLEAQQNALDMIANNISNMNTAGFKRSDVRFSEMLASEADAGAPRSGIGRPQEVGAGVRADQAFRINEQGKLEQTSQPMDLAINGAGFIELMGPNGQTYLWRGGTLKTAEDGQLQTASGIPLKAALSVPIDATGIEIAADGVVRAKTGTAGEMVEIGQLMLVKLDDEGAVDRLDGGLYRVHDDVRLLEAKPGEDGAGTLVQGSIEHSTVELTNEMVNMMMVQRAYSANAQVVQAADQLLALANGLRR